MGEEAARVSDLRLRHLERLTRTGDREARQALRVEMCRTRGHAMSTGIDAWAEALVRGYRKCRRCSAAVEVEPPPEIVYPREALVPQPSGAIARPFGLHVGAAFTGALRKKAARP
jgi:hypothetical protein